MPDPDPGPEQENAFLEIRPLQTSTNVVYFIYKHILKRKCRVMSSETVSAKSIYEELVSKKDALLTELCNTFQSSLSDESFPVNCDTLSDLLDEALMVSFVNILIMKIKKEYKYTASEYLKLFRKDLAEYDKKEYCNIQEQNGESFDKYNWLRNLKRNINKIAGTEDYCNKNLTDDVNDSLRYIYNDASQIFSQINQTNNIFSPDKEPFKMPQKTPSDEKHYDIFTLIIADWMTTIPSEKNHDTKKFYFFEPININTYIADTEHILLSFDKIKKYTNALNRIINDLIELSKKSTDEEIEMFVLHFITLFMVEAERDIILDLKRALYIQKRGYAPSDIDKHYNNDMFTHLFISPFINELANIQATGFIRLFDIIKLLFTFISTISLLHGIFNYDLQIPLLYSESCNPELIKLIDRLNCICKKDMTVDVYMQYSNKKISLNKSNYRYIARKIRKHYISNNRLQSLMVDLNDFNDAKDKKKFIWILSTIEGGEFRKFKADVVPKLNDEIKSKK